MPGSAASGAHHNIAFRPSAWIESTSAFMSTSPRGNFDGTGTQSPSATCQPSSSVAQRKPRRFATGSVAITCSGVNARP